LAHLSSASHEKLNCAHPNGRGWQRTSSQIVDVSLVCWGLQKEKNAKKRQGPRKGVGGKLVSDDFLVSMLGKSKEKQHPRGRGKNTQKKNVESKGVKLFLE